MPTNTRVYHLLLLAAGSAVIAVGSFFVGGVIAEASSAEPIFGITFKAGGALAGFVIAFALLFAAYQRLNVTIPLLRVTVWPPKGDFPATGNPYSARLTIMKYASGRLEQRDAVVIWESAGLTVHLRDIEQDDLVMIELTDCNGKSWRSVYFNPLCSDQQLK
ncbi:MAG: hypothetical protein HYR84_01835 [Planctomycetes bacterium]|nr:hypothetical protein [Planctomycetota bacterium]